jgi:hypothetical protein
MLKQTLIDLIDESGDALNQLATFLIAVRDGDIPADDDGINAMLSLIFEVQDHITNAFN